MCDKYSLKNIRVEPRVFSMLEQNGVRISMWYQTDSYATLALRSAISAELVERILKEPDIFIAYSTTKFVSDNSDGFANKAGKNNTN